mmetsp:Transcript_52971/g.95269  ORF Transcript_52971/g.95269 Transcript_52971/m.95269 type:complete len:147 (+) Transcript_52971:40-480(+)
MSSSGSKCSTHSDPLSGRSSYLNGTNMFKTNHYKSRSAADLSEHIFHQSLVFAKPQRGARERRSRWHSHATTFARGGLKYQGKKYARDPLTGAWFTDYADLGAQFMLSPAQTVATRPRRLLPSTETSFEEPFPGMFRANSVPAWKF